VFGLLGCGLHFWSDVIITTFMQGICGAVVKVLRYKLEGRWFDPSWCHWNFSLT